MKTKINIIALLSAVTLVTGLTSCKKSYSCDCKTTISQSGFSSSSETKKQYSLKMKEKQAKAACDNSGETLEQQMKDLNQGLTVSVSCDLK